MENLGNKISEYRRRLDLTQKELGEKLNVSAQAVSKWENGQAEPDASTIKNLCGIFKISTDELLGNAPPAETAATTATAVESAPVQSAPVQPAVERVVEQIVIAGYCETCKKPIEPGTGALISGYGGVQHLYCRECNEKRVKDETHALRYKEYKDFKRHNTRSFIFGPLIGLGAAAIICVLFMVIIKLEPLWATGLFALGVFIGYTVFGIQLFWEDSVVGDIFCFFLKSFTMPGVIFTLDLDGIIFLILVKIGGAILGAILSVLIFIFGLFFTPVASIFILPFAALKRGLEGRRLKKAAQD